MLKAFQKSSTTSLARRIIKIARAVVVVPKVLVVAITVIVKNVPANEYHFGITWYN